MDGKTVEFRCMVQDILGNEIYRKDNSDQLGDRTIFYCINIPGENEWVRSLKSYGLNIEDPDSDKPRDLDRKSVSLVNKSFPIPSDGKNRSCLIKVYDGKLVDELRVNDIVYVSGVVEPCELQDESQENGAQNENNGNGSASYDNDFEPASDFPHHLVPRVHVKVLKKLQHINPLLPEILSRDKIDIPTIKMARARLSTILTQLFGGDLLVAEYMILSLISRIHRRKDVTTLGQLTIGVSGIKPEMKFLIEKIYEIIEKITTHSHFIDMSIANLNNLSFTPTKDHDNNKMIAGTLQLPDGLYLVLNETALSEGQLTALGTQNLNTLNQIIRWQRHNYEFKFHSVEIDTDLKVLVFSEGKSILTIPYEIRLTNNDAEAISSIRQACEVVDDFLTEDLLNKFRYFITALKDVPEYTIPEEVQKSIQEDFVQRRKNSEVMGMAKFSADDLSSYMTLARYVTLSKGETTLTNDIWRETCNMEAERQARLSLFNASRPILN